MRVATDNRVRETGVGERKFSHDLTESKESAARYRGLLEAAPDAMVVVNHAGSPVAGVTSCARSPVRHRANRAICKCLMVNRLESYCAYWLFLSAARGLWLTTNS